MALAFILLLASRTVLSLDSAIVNGHPCGDYRVVYLWAKAAESAGLTGFFDRVSQRQLLEVKLTAAPC
ncbi:MAG: hypothetical protein CMJ59_25140 [Planctomycetaceae bacterium]|nr:hypothetical protein [Planctomycetaceae bacterium]